MSDFILLPLVVLILLLVSFTSLGLPKDKIPNKLSKLFSQIISEASGPPPLIFNSYVGYNASDPWCYSSNGALYAAGTENSWGQYYSICKNQWLGDFDFISSQGTKLLRLWTYVSEFSYDPSLQTFHDITFSKDSNNVPYINNLDITLNQFQKDGISAYLTLASIPSCFKQNDPRRPYYFTEQFLSNSTLQDAYVNAFSEFITRYKDNNTIVAYDLTNEISTLLDTQPQGTICGIQFDTPDFAKLKLYMARLYNTAKSIDTKHEFTFSMPNMSEKQTDFQFMDPFVDYYDIHAYQDNPSDFYAVLPKLDKPIVQGETGPRTYYTNCIISFYQPVSPGCDLQFLDNTQKWVALANQYNVQTILFEAWPGLTMYGYRTYDSQWNVNGRVLTLSGQYLTGFNSPPSPTPTPSPTSTPIPPTPTNTPIPTPLPGKIPVTGLVSDNLTGAGIAGFSVEVYDDTLGFGKTVTSDNLGYWGVYNFVKTSDIYDVYPYDPPPPTGYLDPVILSNTESICNRSNLYYRTQSSPKTARVDHIVCHYHPHPDCALSGGCNFKFNPAPTPTL